MEDYYGKLDEDGRDSLQRVRGATQRMGQLIDDLLKLSRVTRGEIDHSTGRPDFHSRGNRGGAAEYATGEAGDLPDRPRDWFRGGTPTWSRWRSQNLLGNAWKFTAKQQEAAIEFGSRIDQKGPLAFFVRDNGAGFDMAYADKLFGTFQRLHSDKEYPGTGIGLSIVQRVVHRHDGSVWAEGVPGGGATFWFTLDRPVHLKGKDEG